MGTKARVMHGSRAQLYIDGKIVGIFNSCSTGISYDSNPVYILGKFNAAEIALTGMEPVTVNAQGFRVVDNGPYEVANVPMLQELLNNEDISLSLFDRQTGKEIMTVVGVRATGWTTDVSSRALQSLSVSFVGLALSDEHGAQDEEGSATKW